MFELGPVKLNRVQNILRILRTAFTYRKYLGRKNEFFLIRHFDQRLHLMSSEHYGQVANHISRQLRN